MISEKLGTLKFPQGNFRLMHKIIIIWPFRKFFTYISLIENTRTIRFRNKLFIM